MIPTQAELVDREDRKLAATDLSEVYLVEAAAGTGKTTLLVSRILTIVATTLTPLTRVVAITFTEKAAGDLKVKLREKLEAAAQEEGDGAERFRMALHDLDAMPVSTIHAFCRELIAQRPVEADVEPGLGVSDEPTARMLADEAWQAWVGEQFSADCDVARPFLERGVEPDGSGSSLRGLFELLNDYREDIDLLHVECADEDCLRREVEAFRAEMEHALELGSVCRDAEDTLAVELGQLRGWYEHARWEDLDAVVLTLLSRYTPNGNRRGKQENWPKETLEFLRVFLKETYPALVVRLLSRITSYQAAPLIEWLKGAVRSYSRLKSEHGVLDFHDLLITARDMLKGSRAARDFFKARYDYILVDEFQDTDPLQAEIIFYLAERSDSCAESWEDVKLDSVKLFIVGDPKQSIYRFRRADLDLYGRVMTRIAECGKNLSIRANFRSHPAIVEEVNAIFESWMAGKTEQRYEPLYVTMDAARLSVSSEPAVVVLPPSRKVDLTQNADRLAELEAACIAEYIRVLVTNGRLIPQPDGSMRKVSFRDIGILYRATTHLNALENALRWQNIPFQVSGGKNLPQRTEIQALRSVLSAIDNPYDAMSVVAALRTPFFACSDEELLEHRMDGGKFDYLQSSAVEHIERSFVVLRKLHSQSRHVGPSETVAALFDMTAGLQIYALKPQGEARAANLLKVLDIARELEGGGHSSFHELVRWLNRLEELRVGEEDSPIAEAGDDVVQLMTFHKAKGLEFPAVILFRLSQDHEVRKESAVIDRGDKRVEFRMGGCETAGFADALKEEQDRQWYESIRLLYVAMTRARDLLVIPAYWSKERSDTSQERQWFLRLLRAHLPEGENGIPQVDRTRFTLQDTDAYVLETELDERLVLDMEQGYSAEQKAESRAAYADWESRRAKCASVLERHNLFIKPSEHGERPSAPAQQVVIREENAKRFGSFLHSVMEQISLPDGENAEEAIALAAAKFGMGEAECTEARALLRQILASELFSRRLRGCSTVLREMPFVVERNGALVEGAMDLVFLEYGKPVIVDFKTDHVTAARARDHAKSYTGQAAEYVRALERIIGTQVPEVLLYFVRPDTVVSLPREELLDSLR